jgi:hypothetical protein
MHEQTNGTGRAAPTVGASQGLRRPRRGDTEAPPADRGPDLEGLDDPAFLAARADVRGQLEQAPGDPRLAAEDERMTAEFDRRARAAWQAGAA